MTDSLLDRLRSATAPAYEVLREVGHGGMARVFLARDQRYPRQVAVKVMHPEIAAAIGPDRFLREIRLTASLTHPHILPLIESGEKDGLLYYVMPFVEGETLRARLDRVGMLPIEDVVEIARQVGAALEHAHAHGVVHRDIKPENILLAGDQAFVADFGVARAVGDLGIERLTEIGLAVGTVAYMSPEQAVADPHLDGRSDQYAFGCVVYEMLVGQPPFAGRDSRGIIARHALDPVPPIRTIRGTVPIAMEQAVFRALAKLPADRFTSTAGLVHALEAGVAGAVPLPPPRERRRTVLIAVLSLGALALLVAALLFQRGIHDGGSQHLDPNLIAVLPFRNAGIKDSTVLAPEGIVEILHTALSGGTTLHTVDPGRLLHAWLAETGSRTEPLDDQAALRVARRLQAGKLLLGQVLESRDSVILSARLLAVPGGAELLRVERIAGPVSDALGLLDQLAVQLLARGAGKAGPHLEDLYTRNIEAFREYMAGAERYRRGRYEEATAHYQNAIRLDSTFALAALDLGLAAALTDGSDLAPGAVATAWAHRDLLSPSGRLFLRALAGPHYPEPSTILEDISLWERTVDSIPERAEASYALGDILFHDGAAVGRQSSLLLAHNAFRRALADDSALAPALEHLIEIAAITGDTAEVDQLARRYFAVDSLGDHADFVHWRVAVARADSTQLAVIRERLPRFSDGLLQRVMGTAQLDGVALEDAAVAAHQLRARAQNPYQLWSATLGAQELALNLGRPSEAPTVPTNQGFALPVTELFTVVSAIFWDGDGARAAQAAKRRRPEARKRPPAGGNPKSPVYTDVCTVGLWDAAVGNWSEVAYAVRTLRTAQGIRPQTQTRYITVCEAILFAQLAAGLRYPEAAAALVRLDSLMLAVYPEGGAYLLLAGNLTAARLFEAAGNISAALAAVRRRTYFYDSNGVAGLSTLLREEGRLAALSGDRDGAIRAYNHYLALRLNPEPGLASDVAEVRRALAQLSADHPQ